MDKKTVPILDVINGQATVDTKGIYRLVYHNIRSKRVRKIYRDREFLTAEDAIQLAEIHNNLTLSCYDCRARCGRKP